MQKQDEAPLAQIVPWLRMIADQRPDVAAAVMFATLKAYGIRNREATLLAGHFYLCRQCRIALILTRSAKKHQVYYERDAYRGLVCLAYLGRLRQLPAAMHAFLEVHTPSPNAHRVKQALVELTAPRGLSEDQLRQQLIQVLTPDRVRQSWETYGDTTDCLLSLQRQSTLLNAGLNKTNGSISCG